MNKKFEIYNLVSPKQTYKQIKKEYQDYIKNQRVLIVIENNNPFKVCFDGHKVQAEFIYLEKNNLYKISPNEAMQSIFNNYIVKITGIQYYKFRRFEYENNFPASDCELIDFCSINSYMEEEVKHSVDAICLLDENGGKINEAMNVAFPPCFFKKLNDEEKKNAEKSINSNANSISNNGNDYELQKYDLIKREIIKYEKYKNDESKLRSLTKEKIEEFIFTFEDYFNSINSISNYVERNEFWELLEEVSFLREEITMYLNLFRKHK